MPADITTRMDIINHVFRQGEEHRYAYDGETLIAKLLTAGFPTVVEQRYGESSDPMLTGDREVHRAYSLYVEATKG